MTRKAYPEFTRGHVTWYPYWRAWQVGEKRYSINEDCFYECIEEDIRLETRSINDKAKHETQGKNPHELGYVHEEHPERWKILPV